MLSILDLMPIKHRTRTRTEILGQIVQLASSSSTEGIGKTRIMYNALLTYPQLQEHLSTSIQYGLLEYLPATKTYKPTEKGMRFLILLEKLQQELTPTSIINSNSTTHRSINRKGVWQIKASAPIIVTVVLSSIFSLATAFA
jgi:predicted transcriptional regulator